MIDSMFLFLLLFFSFFPLISLSFIDFVLVFSLCWGLFGAEFYQVSRDILTVYNTFFFY